MNGDYKQFLEEMFVNDDAMIMMRYKVKHDRTLKVIHEKIMNYGLSELQALMLMIDITEITRKKDK